MGGIEGNVDLVIGIAVVLFVLALIWATVIVGLIRIVREKVRENAPAESGPNCPQGRDGGRVH
jgi:Na+-transporting methylmalonyl-CoA/oxaloacetate decarboxylase gamma subunit